MTKNVSGKTLYDDLTIHDWTGRVCQFCQGTGEDDDQETGRRACVHCGGTGEEYGFVIWAPCVEGGGPK